MSDFDVGATTYDVISQIYPWFGITLQRNTIPYTKTEDSTTIIDIEQIKAI